MHWAIVEAPSDTTMIATKSPIVYHGGKSQAAPLVWSLLGDPDHYVEPFAGSLAVLLKRPHVCNRSHFSETVNDIDGFICNFWRSVQWDPVATAEAASWPVCESDKSARQIALIRWREAGAGERLAGDATFYDPVMAGWWAWAVSVQIGPFVTSGAWTADPMTGVITKQERVNGREPGVKRNPPQLINSGRGVTNQAAREPGVKHDLPYLSHGGRGVVHATAREPGVLLPPGPEHGRSALDDFGHEYHDLAMPKLIRWFRLLSARLRHVRILNGDWSRLMTKGVLQNLPVRQGGIAGVFLDPPYADTADRMMGVYDHDSGDVAHEVREWCLKNGDNPRYRIVLAGYEGEHGEELQAAGWAEHEWFKDGWLRGGMAVQGKDGHQQHRERLFASPHCLSVCTAPQMALGLEEEAVTIGIP
jgi:hypothetical protein